MASETLGGAMVLLASFDSPLNRIHCFRLKRYSYPFLAEIACLAVGKGFGHSSGAKGIRTYLPSERSVR